jgi:hypothetical protein
MLTYKRNQVEDAVARVNGLRASSEDSEFLTRLKRLMDADRAMAVKSKPDIAEHANYAFFSGNAPGKGGEVQFSAYDAFALMLGLQMLNHNWPQKFVVGELRRLRTPLERRHRAILKLDPVEQFDADGIERSAGTPALATTSPVFLLIWSDQKRSPSAEIFEDPRAAFKRTLEKPGRSSTWIELTRSAHALSEQLSKSLPRKRGRS